MATLNARLTAFAKEGYIFRRWSGQKLDGKAYTATIALCLIITKHGMTAPYIALCSYNQMPDGAVEGVANSELDLTKDPQNPYAADTNLTYREIHKDDEVILCLGTSRGATINYVCCVDNDNPGYVEAMSPSNESIAQVPPFRILGRFMATYTAVSNKAQLAWVKGK